MSWVITLCDRDFSLVIPFASNNENLWLYLTLSWRRPISYRNQSIDSQISGLVSIFSIWYRPPSWKGLNRTTKAYLEWLRKLWWTATLPLIFAVALEFIDCSILNQSPNQSCWHLIFHINIIFQLQLILYLTLKILRLWWFYPPLGYKEKLDGETMDPRRKSTDWQKHLNTAVLIYK